jgi:hypothetical protein
MRMDSFGWWKEKGEEGNKEAEGEGRGQKAIWVMAERFEGEAYMGRRTSGMPVEFSIWIGART